MCEDAIAHNIKSQRSIKKDHDVDNIRYTVASTQDTIDQYYHLLEEIGQNYISKNFQVTPKEHLINNLYGKIIVAINEDNNVVGGARLIISSSENRCDLPLESSSFKLNNIFPEFQLNKKTYAEWGRFIAYPGISNKKIISENIARKCVMNAIENGVCYLFGVPIACMKKRYEEIFSNMKLSFKELLPPGNMPSYPTSPDIDFYLAVSDLNDIYNTNFGLLKSSVSSYL